MVFSRVDLTQIICLQAMAWVGPRLVVATSLRYMLLEPGNGSYKQVFAVPDEAPYPTTLLALPRATHALLLLVGSPIYPCCSSVYVASEA